jgi:wyosine [tRNA(Phe)-imidazoG37] synthetase (radical SAM superfamily)
MQYVYGPIPSRRLGRSLGVDPIPLKTCNWNCIYCQLGRSTPLVNERRAYVDPALILGEIRAVLAHHPPGDIDFVSFVGSGEPTLHSELGWMLRQVKAMTPIPVAVITNGSLLYQPAVRDDLAVADVVMPTLSAGSAAVYKRIHRPHPEATYARLVEGLLAFRSEYRGRLWVELMLLRGVNDSEAALRDLAAVITQVAPDEVHVVLPERPPAEPWVEPPNAEGMMRAVAVLGPIAHIVHPYVNGIDVSDYSAPDDAILGIVMRHPMSDEQLNQLLKRWSPAELAAALARLEQSGQVHGVVRLGMRFWTAAPAVFPN